MSAVASTHRVDPVEYKIEENLLQLDRVADDLNLPRTQGGVKRHATRVGLDPCNIHRLAGDSIEIDANKVIRMLGHEHAQLANDFGGALIAMANVLQDLSQCQRVRCVGIEDQLRRFGIVENAAQRLVQLVGDG